MKKSIICLFSLLSVAGAMGQARLKVTKKSGNDQWYQLLDTKITFEGSQVVITERGGKRAPISFYDVAKMTVVEPPSSVEKVASQPKLSVFINGEELHFKGVESDETQKVAIYNLKGQCLYQSTQSLNRAITISTLTQGVYLVRTQNQTIKFIL